MQRGLDAEVAAKVQQQHVKEVSDQQWHLSIVREVNAAGFCSKLLSLILANQVTVDRLPERKYITSQVTMLLRLTETGPCRKRKD